MQTKKLAVYYAIWSLVLLVTEIIIGKYLNDWHFVRNYVGDILVVPLIYCLIRVVTNRLPRLMPFLVCCIGFIAEISQYFQLYARLGFEKGSLPAIILGSQFSWWDILCYTIGMGLIYLFLFIRTSVTRKEQLS